MSTAAIVIAASVADEFNRVGAIAGLASVVGLGVLSMLYFAQAREVKRLREWAGRAPERAAELEHRVQSDAQRRVVAQPITPGPATPAVPATPAAQQAEAARAAAAAALYAKVPPPPPPPAPLVPRVGQLARPGVPVATIQPPTAPGAVPTQASPVPAPAPGRVAPAQPTAVTVPRPVPTPNPAPAAGVTQAPGSVGPTPAATPTPATTQPTTVATKAPPAKATSYPTAATAAAAAAAAAARRTASAPSAIGNGSSGQDTREDAAARPGPLPNLPNRPRDDDDGLSAGRVFAIVGGAVVAVLVAIVLMVSLNGDDPAPPPNDIGQNPPPAASDPEAGSDSESGGSQDVPGAAPPSVDRPATNIAVLNGTTQTGLARGVADKLEQAKFTISSVGNNADQRVPQTIVSYGEGNERAAQIVADTIGVDRSVVQASDRNATAAAEADVVVTVGTDQIE